VSLLRNFEPLLREFRLDFAKIRFFFGGFALLWLEVARFSAIGAVEGGGGGALN
jgi:hypothetical protein